MRRTAVLACLLLLATSASGCAVLGVRGRGEDRVRVGVFATLTHAPAHVADGAGIFDRVLGSGRVELVMFDSGTDAGIALMSGSIDAAYMGPWPTASLHLLTGSVAVVSGLTAGGASLVVRAGAGIDGPADLHGTRLAVPDVNNSQEVSLRSWLHGNGLRALDEGGDVAVVGLGGFDVASLLEHGRLDGAWLPEPYPAALVDRGVAERLVDEEDLWPPGELLSANLVVSTSYLDEHPDVVRGLVEATVEAIRLCAAEPDRAKRLALSRLAAMGAPPLDRSTLDAAWGEMAFTWDPLSASLERVARQAFDVGFVDDPPGEVRSLYRLDALNDVLNDEGLPPVEVST